MSGGIFLTGAASFIGGALIRRARSAGVPLSGIDLVAPEGGEFQRADINDPDLADLIPDDASTVVHLAALSRDAECRGQGRECFAANVVGALNVAAAAARRGLRQMIFASSEWVYDDPERAEGCGEETVIDVTRLESEYALSKLTAEMALRQQLRDGPCALTVLRFGIVYGERDRNWGAVESLLHRVATTTRITVGARATARRYLHVEDVAEAILTTIGRAEGETINIQGPRLVGLGEVIDLAADLLGRHPQVVETAPERPSVRRVSSEKAERLLGWRAAIDIATGLERLIDHFGYREQEPETAASG